MKAFFSRFARHRTALLGLVVLVTILLLAIAGPFLYPRNAFELAGQPFLEPFGKYLLGTDSLGRDVAAGIVQGARTSLSGDPVL